MGAQHQRTLVFGLEMLAQQLRPQLPGGAQLGHLHKQVHADAEEERQARRELVHIQPGAHCGTHIFQGVGEGEAELLH